MIKSDYCEKSTMGHKDHLYKPHIPVCDSKGNHRCHFCFNPLEFWIDRWALSGSKKAYENQHGAIV